jgi:hypothetical protein
MQIKFLQKCCRKVLINPNGISSHSQSMGSKHAPYIFVQENSHRKSVLIAKYFLVKAQKFIKNAESQQAKEE